MQIDITKHFLFERKTDMAMMMSNWVDKNLNAYRIDVECAAPT